MYLWVTKIRSGSKCRRHFDFAVNIIFVGENGSGNFCLGTRAMFQCLIVTAWSSVIIKRVFKFASCVSCIVKTGLAHTSFRSKMASAVDFRTATFCSSVIMASTGSSIKAVPRSTSMSKFSTTANSTVVSRSPVPTGNLTSLLLSRRFLRRLKMTVALL